jgi:hypothetical protein
MDSEFTDFPCGNNCQSGCKIRDKMIAHIGDRSYRGLGEVIFVPSSRHRI